MTGAELTKLATELGIDAVGAAPIAAYDDTERHIRDRRERGLFADMRFTMARPEVSCHPETSARRGGDGCCRRAVLLPRRARILCRTKVAFLATRGATSTRSSVLV